MKYGNIILTNNLITFCMPYYGFHLFISFDVYINTFYIYLFHFRIYTLIQSLFGFPANGKQFTKIDKPLNLRNVLPPNIGPIIFIPRILYADKT